MFYSDCVLFYCKVFLQSYGLYDTLIILVNNNNNCTELRGDTETDIRHTSMGRTHSWSQLSTDHRMKGDRKRKRGYKAISSPAAFGWNHVHNAIFQYNVRALLWGFLRSQPGDGSSAEFYFAAENPAAANSAFHPSGVGK